VAKLPGVTGAQLNPTAGKLIVEGSLDLDAIRAEGGKENYTIRTMEERRAAPPGEKGVDWDLVRTVAAGIGLAVGIAAEKLGAAPPAFTVLFAGTIVLGGWGNFRKAVRSLPKLDFNMSVLMSVAIVGAVAIGEWEEAAVVAFLFSASEMLESWTMDRARRSIGDLMGGVPSTARIQATDGDIAEVAVEEVRVGDLMVVRPGEKLALDGVIESGSSSLDEASITGESVPAEKTDGADVFAGTLNGEGLLRVRVTRLVDDTTVARIVHMVEEAQTKRAPSQAFVEKFAAIYTPVVLALAAAIVLLPPLLFGQPWEAWIYRGLSLLIVSCPCALVVSTPVSIVSAISNAARRGVLIKGGIYLEQMGSIRAIAFDKTGTLTEGRPSVTDVVALNDMDEARLLQLAASLESGSQHPLAAAIVREAEARSVALLPPLDMQSVSGLGVRAKIDGHEMVVGSPRMLADNPGIMHVQTALDALYREGKTAVLVQRDDVLAGVIGIADEVRTTSRDAITWLKQAGIEHTIMLTGDNPAAAAAISHQAGVDEFRAELLPDAKVDAVSALLDKYGKVAMVGDGVNDAPALATATVGIAMGGAGTDTALETADIALMADDLSQLPFAVGLSRAALRTIKLNIAFAIGVKMLALLLMFPGWLTLWMAIMTDMGASIVVTINGMRLLRWKE
jgi:Cd2+/Zn2+-exporting ATPase